MWRWLQSQFDTPILPNPPSSGFLGVVLALRSCARVNVYEYVPSMRLTKRCHYYDTQENLGCTIGDWHPLAAEKLVTLKLNSANDTTVFSDGYVSIKVCSTHKGRTGGRASRSHPPRNFQNNGHKCVFNKRTTNFSSVVLNS